MSRKNVERKLTDEIISERSRRDAQGRPKDVHSWLRQWTERLTRAARSAK